MKKILAIVLFCTAIAAFGQEAGTFTLDGAINDAMRYLVGRLEPETKVAVLNFGAYSAIADYVIEEITVFLVNESSLTVVDRSELEVLREEMDFQLSGEVSDKSAQSIGKKLGAQTVIVGSLSPFGKMWRMRIRALEVETAKVQGMRTYTVENDPVISNSMPKTAGQNFGTGVLNIVLGLGSYLEGDIAGGLTLTAGYAAAAGLFLLETTLDWESPAVGIPAAIGVTAAGLTLIYGFVRPFIYNRNPQMAAALDNVHAGIVPASDTGFRNPGRPGVRLVYSVKF